MVDEGHIPPVRSDQLPARLLTQGVEGPVRRVVRLYRRLTEERLRDRGRKLDVRPGRRGRSTPQAGCTADAARRSAWPGRTGFPVTMELLGVLPQALDRQVPEEAFERGLDALVEAGGEKVPGGPLGKVPRIYVGQSVRRQASIVEVAMYSGMSTALCQPCDLQISRSRNRPQQLVAAAACHFPAGRSCSPSPAAPRRS